jgi:hypothetical protein
VLRDHNNTAQAASGSLADPCRPRLVTIRTPSPLEHCDLFLLHHPSLTTYGPLPLPLHTVHTTAGLQPSSTLEQRPCLVICSAPTRLAQAAVANLLPIASVATPLLLRLRSLSRDPALAISLGLRKKTPVETPFLVLQLGLWSLGRKLRTKLRTSE